MNRTLCIALFICGILSVRPLYSVMDIHDDKISTLNTGDALDTLESFSAFDTTDTFDIDTIDITYGYRYSVLDQKTYTISLKGGNYFSDGKMVDPHLIQEFQESFTDFYESSTYEYTYEDIIVYDHTPSFTVVVAFMNGETLTLRTTSDYHCFIPWNIEYEGKTYVQYNGRISTAFLRILIELDSDAWKNYERTARFGCYPAIVPEKYLNKGLSSNFPVSQYVLTPEVKRGRSHVLWEIYLQDHVIGKPVYVNGKVVVITYNNLICFDAETGKKLWLVAFHDKKSYGIYLFHAVENLLVSDGLVYAAGPDSVVYCVNLEAGEVLWSHKADISNPSIRIAEDSLLVFGRGIECLNRVTGKRIWRVTENVHSENIYDDKILFTMWKDDSYFVLRDIPTGDVLWKVEDTYWYTPVYDDGIIYLITKKNELTALDLHSEKVIWSYQDTGSLFFEVFENSILVIVSDEEGRFLSSVVLLNKTGEILWKYMYSDETVKWVLGHAITAHLHRDTLFLIVGEGVVQAFDTCTGEFLWKIEVKGRYVTSFQIYRERVYLTGNDGELYCLRINTGEILWKYVAVKELFIWFDREPHAYTSEMKDNLIFVGTKNGNLVALSRYPLFLIIV